MPFEANDLREVNRELQQLYSQIGLETEIANRIMVRFQPRLPEMGAVRFAYHHQSFGTVPSDCCDVAIVDDQYVNFWVADTMQHGVGSALVASLLNQLTVQKRRDASNVGPGEILHQLNRDLLALQISEPAILTMIYGTINVDSGSLKLARAANPKPIICHADGSASIWSLPGTFLGVHDANFHAETKLLCPNDRLVILSDGYATDPLEVDHKQVIESIKTINSLPLADFVSEIASYCSKVAPLTDDRTILALEFRPEN